MLKNLNKHWHLWAGGLAAIMLTLVFAVAGISGGKREVAIFAPQIAEARYNNNSSSAHSSKYSGRKSWNLPTNSGTNPTPAPVSTVTPPTSQNPTGTASTTAPTTTQTAAPPSTNAPVTQSSMKWGAFLADGNAASFESLVGKKMGMQATFVGWGSGNSFPSELGSTVRDQGKTLVVFWEQYGTTLDNIIAGTDDAYIKQFASDAKAYSGPIILAPFHEMNGDWDPWDGPMSGNSPAKVISAWKHVYALFNGDTNVKFAWDVNNESEPNTSSNSITA